MADSPKYIPPSSPIVRVPFIEEGPKVVADLKNATLVLTNDMVVQARRYVQSGATAGKLIEWRDAKQTGLVLRLGSKTATWYLRRRKKTFKIGSADDISIYTARSLAATAIRIDDIKSDAHHYLRKMNNVIINDGHEVAYYYEQKLWIDDKGRLHGPETPMPEEVWTWHHLRQEFISYKKPNLAQAWGPQYEAIMHHPAFESIEYLAVSKIRLKDLMIVKKKLSEQLPASQASRAINQARAMLDWALAEYPIECGFDEDTIAWWVRLRIKHTTKKRHRAPSVQEMVRTILVAEHLYETGRKDGGGIGAGTIGALWAVVLTGQRIGALLKTPTGRFFKSPDLSDDWRVVNWTAAEMKSVIGESLPHSLPISCEAIEIIDRYRQLAGRGGERWLFPSARGEKAVSNAGLEGLLRRLQGIRYQVDRYPPGEGPGRSGKRDLRSNRSTRKIGTNLLAEHGIEPWTPHDVRRSLASFLDDRDLGGAGSAILAHRERSKDKNKDFEEERALLVTQVHYSRAQKIRLKQKGMKIWIEAIIATYNAEKNRAGTALDISRAGLPI